MLAFGCQSRAVIAQRVLDFSTGVKRWRQPLAYGLRFWISVCTALFVAFSLELDQPYWAATSAAIVCLPQVGPSLRKGWLRIVGTATGAIAGVVLAASFPQDRIGFFVGLAAWGALSAFTTTLLRNYSSYAAALAGYTAAIVAGGSLGATGGVHADIVFHLAISRFSEICIGIVCAGVVRTLTDRGDAEHRLASAIADLSRDILARFIAMLESDVASSLDMQAVRHDVTERVIALEPIIEHAMGESSRIRFSSPVMQRTTDGLLAALTGWRAIDVHLQKALAAGAGNELRTILECIAPVRTELAYPGAQGRWLDDPRRVRDIFREAINRLVILKVNTPSQRLLADKTAEFLSGIVHALNGLVLLVDPESGAGAAGRNRFRVADYLPALTNGARTFLMLCVVSGLWVITGWPNGDAALTLAMVVCVLQAARGDGAFAGGLVFAGGAVAASLLAMVATFAILPLIATNFIALAGAIGLIVVPLTSLSLVIRRPPWLGGMLVTTAVLFMPILEATNPTTYEAADLLNRTLAFAVGCLLGASSFRLLPPLSPEYRMRRLLALTLEDLHRIARGRPHEDWSGHVLGRLIATPGNASPLQRAALIVALSVGNEISQLRHIAERVGFGQSVRKVSEDIARSRPQAARDGLAELDAHLSSLPATQTLLRARAGILVLSEALSQHSDYFAGRIPQ